MSDVTVVVKTKGADQAAKDLKDVGDAAEKAHGPIGKLGGALGDIGKIAGGFVVGEGITKLGGFLTSAAQAAAEDEQSMARLNATLKTLGGNFEENSAKVQAAIKHGQELAFTDDDVRDSFDKLAQATGSTDEALQRQTLAMDLARGAHIPLSDASKLLGKVTDENLQVFKRLGITLPDVANEADVLAAVQAKFAGQSDAYATSTAGQFEQTKIRMSELKEQIGAQLLPVMTKIGEVLLNDVIPKMEQFANWWAANVQPRIAAFMEYVIPKLREFGEAVAAEFAKFQTYYNSDIAPAVENIKIAIIAVVDTLKEHWSQIEPFVRPIFIAIETMMNTLKDAIKLVLDIIQGDWEGAWNDIKDMVSGVFDGIIALGGAFKDQIVAVFSAAKDLILALDWLQLGKDLIQLIIDGVVALASEATNAAVGVFTDAKAAIMGIDWWNVGADIIRWAARGLRDVAGDIVSAAENVRDRVIEKLDPRNWKINPVGIENWYPFYLKKAFANMAAEAESNPDLLRVRDIVAKQMDVAFAVVRNAAAGAAAIGPAGSYNPWTDSTSTGTGTMQGSWWQPGDPDVATIMAAQASYGRTGISNQWFGVPGRNTYGTEVPGLGVVTPTVIIHANVPIDVLSTQIQQSNAQAIA